jgi:hypothetical protein
VLATSIDAVFLLEDVVVEITPYSSSSLLVSSSVKGGI